VKYLTKDRLAAEQRMTDQYNSKMHEGKNQIKMRLYEKTVSGGHSHRWHPSAMLPITSCWCMQEEEICEMFKKIDKDMSGLLNTQELQKLFQSLHVFLSPYEIDNAMAEMDSSGDRGLSYEELKEWLIRSELWDPVGAAVASKRHTGMRESMSNSMRASRSSQAGSKSPQPPPPNGKSPRSEVVMPAATLV
jgi:hypothetical protein